MSKNLFKSVKRYQESKIVKDVKCLFEQGKSGSPKPFKEAVEGR